MQEPLAPDHDLHYQPDQYGSMREEVEAQIDAALACYARVFPGGHQAARWAKQEIALILDHFEQRAANLVADHNGLEGPAGGLEPNG